MISGNGYGQFDELIPSVAAFLGEQGLLFLKRFFTDHGGPDATYALRQIALARGDIDGFIAQFDRQQLSRPSIATDVALQLLEAGRPEEALTVLDEFRAHLTEWFVLDWGDARIAVLTVLDRLEEAQQQRWDLFCSRLSVTHLRCYLKQLDDFADVESEELAIQFVEQHPDSLLALDFLIHWPALPRAARYVIDHSQQWDGEAFAQLGSAASVSARAIHWPPPSCCGRWWCLPSQLAARSVTATPPTTL